ncbi:YcxB family protein [Novosphingobium sp. 1949]|uniref:YcxB family protein n=1 Tax=Novosphingobium organovorum TaxID=2930092 RepID=A0ABT0B7S2_9SPHN|nr:YcxB family protein [Novosphingobium organovorum]MCJ2181115.1 YcxB family protein [Novosphingobium organovorum]
MSAPQPEGFTTRYTFPDYLRANRLLALKAWRGWRGLVTGSVIIVLLMAMNFAPGASGVEQGLFRAVYATMGYLALLAGLIALYFALVMPRKAKKRFEANGLEGASCHYRFTADGFTIESGEAQRAFTWGEFAWWTQDDALLLLRTKGPMMVWLPRAQISVETLQAFRQALAGAGVREV